MATYQTGNERSFSRPRRNGPAHQSSGARSGRPSSARPSFGSRSGGSRGRSSFSSGGRRGFGAPRRRGRSERIDHSLFIYKPTEAVQVKKYTPENTFASLGLPKAVANNLERKGLKLPTEIQDKIIPHGMHGDDVIGLAATGSGKTLAFLLPLIHRFDQKRDQKVLILAPTRELAQQINSEFMAVSYGMKLFSTVCVGGMPIFRQINSLKRENHFIIGTPGRIKDLADRGVLDYSKFNAVVLDEVDRMLDMGFVDDITAILNSLPVERQSFFFSATMPERIKNLIHAHLREPKVIDTGAGVSTKNVTQDIVRTARNGDEKFAKLSELLTNAKKEKSIIFVETKSGVDDLTKQLKSGGFKAGLIHGDRRQRERERVLSDFKLGKIDILVATDVAARGIDVKDVYQVINYTVPQTYDDYIHRIGRTGRAGKLGKAFTFVS